MKKNYVTLALCFLLSSACGGQSLLDPAQSANENLGPNSVFAQIEVGTQGSGSGFEIPNYRIEIEEGGMVIANVQWLQTSATAASVIRFNHEGEDHGPSESESEEDSHHEEPTNCDFAGSLNAAIYVDLTRSTHLPCVKMPKGNYSGVKFSLVDPAGLSVQGLPATLATTLHLHGHAENLTTSEVFPFSLSAKVSEEVQLTGAIELSDTHHHVEIKIDLATWFHGFDFDTLDTSEGEVMLDASHNVGRFDHLLEHMMESFSLGSSDD